MKDISAVIKADERRYDGILKKTAKDICESGVKAVFISGGSCAGKTTTTKKLCRCIEKYGRTCHIVSLDDFYRSYGESVYLPDGTRDVETVNSLRIDLVTYALSAILENRTASIPLFDFKTKERTDSHRAISPREGDITVIEGLHALNPLILSKGFLNA
ncbi:MAG: hypothetical protein J5793_02870, partial [Clostridia bacterium]|nr:hypothetical protein [Clostridia bacterium]